MRACTTFPAARSEKRVVSKLSSERWRSSKAASEMDDGGLLVGDRTKSHGRRMKSVCARCERGVSQGIAEGGRRREGGKTDGDQVLFDGPHQDADDVL